MDGGVASSPSVPVRKFSITYRYFSSVGRKHKEKQLRIHTWRIIWISGSIPGARFEMTQSPEIAPVINSSTHHSLLKCLIRIPPYGADELQLISYDDVQCIYPIEKTPLSSLAAK